MNVELITQILVLAITSSLVSTQLIQRLKENFQITNKTLLAICSCIVSFATGFFFTVSFSKLGKDNACWVGVITYAGADIIYQNFKDKLNLKSISELKEKGDDK